MLKHLLVILFCWAVSPRHSIPRRSQMTEAAGPKIQEEMWALPFPLPVLAYVVRPLGDGPFPLVVMNHGISLDANQRTMFPTVEYRDAAFWFARRGYFVISPIRYGPVVSMIRTVGSSGLSLRMSAVATTRTSVVPGSPSPLSTSGSSST